MDGYGTFSGFTFNWDKSVIMHIDPVDPIQLEHPGQVHLMKHVFSFKYPGIIVTPDINKYIDKNILPCR